MYERDANNATWYVLRYARDFDTRAPAPPADPAPPALDPTLFYDDARAVLELLPQAPGREVQPLSGLAIDADGEIYRVDPDTGALLVRACDGTERPLVCESQVFADPRGLALDRRGLLYVADPGAHRVVIIQPDDGTVRAILNGGALQEPVDVAVSPTGRVYVADRAVGSIVMFSARFARRGKFFAQNADGLPAKPRPIAVMVDADDTVLVADAAHPRLLHFTAAGEPLADVQLSTAAAAAPPLTLAEIPTVPIGDAPRFIAGACTTSGPCAPPAIADDGGDWLATTHRALRLQRLRLGRSFASFGTSLSAALDSGTLGTVWHRIELDGDVPAGTRVTIETSTTDNALDYAAGTTTWTSPIDPRGRLIAYTSALPDQLVQSAPGRYVRLRIGLESDGTATPSIRAVRVLYPRISYLELLPRVYRRDADSARFLEQYLALFERMITRVEDRYELFSRQINPDAAPSGIIDWLASLIDLAFDPSWSLARRRALVAAAIQLYRTRGTISGLRRYLEIYTGMDPVIIERFRERPGRAAFLGRPGNVTGSAMPLTSPAPSATPEEELYREYAHRFTLVVYLQDECDAPVAVPVIDRIVEANKPAHTIHTLRVIYPDARVGEQSTVGLDFVIGGRRPGGTRLRGCPVPGEAVGSMRGPEGILGADTVLGERRPMYPRERELGL
jgi:phage tail-like protein